MEARLAYADSQGRTLYPDANGSLRFTYGKVTGKSRDGLTWAPFTTAEGLAAKQTGKGEFDAPDKAIELIQAKDYGPYRSRARHAAGRLHVDGRHHQRQFGLVDAERARASSSAWRSTARSKG